MIYMSVISGCIFAVGMCHIKIPSNFCFPISCLSVPKKLLQAYLLQSLPTMLSMEWPPWLTISHLVEFTGNKFVIYLRVGSLGILQTAVMYNVYQEPTKLT